MPVVAGRFEVIYTGKAKVNQTYMGTSGARPLVSCLLVVPIAASATVDTARRYS